jgi:hypothetical protein
MHSPSNVVKAGRLRRWSLGFLLALGVVVAVSVIPIWINIEIPGSENHRVQDMSNGSLPAIPSGDRHVLLLMIDGFSVGPFQQALDQGRMPNLAALMTDRPTASLVALSTFPSATSPSVQELLSGRYVDMDRLPGPAAVHAFDRDELTVVRYVTHPDAWQWPEPTLFDAVAGRPAVTVFEGRWDGPIAILTQYNLMGQAFLEAIGASKLSGGDRGPVEAYLKLLKTGAPPVVSLVVLNEFDMVSHFHGPTSSEALRALERADGLLGEIVTALATTFPGSPPDTAGKVNGPDPSGDSLLAHTAILIFGDHGISPSGRFINLPEFFARKGLSAVDVATMPHVLFRERLGSLWTSWTDVILVAGGSNITQVYLKDSVTGWAGRTETGEPKGDAAAADKRRRELARELTGLEGVDQVFWVDAASALHVMAPAAQEALILTAEKDGENGYAYLVADPVLPDPFGYLAHPTTSALVCRTEAAVATCYHSLMSWVDATTGSQYPGAVPLLPKAFRPAQFSGDLMIAARQGYTFLRGQHGDHGNLDRSAMLTPLIINGPGVVAGAESHQPRLVDIYPTAAVLLGAAADDKAFATLDGRVLDCVMPPGGKRASTP